MGEVTILKGEVIPPHSFTFHPLTLTMYFDRFDIVSAHYAFCADYHEGQGSELYAKLCRIGNYFSPSIVWKGYDSLSENWQIIYDNLVSLHN